MASTTTGLTGLMQTFYDKVFLDRAETEIVYDVGAQAKKVPMNSGKTVYFNRFSPLAVQTTALTEATNPTAIDMSTTIVSATVAEYGGFTTVGSLFNMTSIDEGLKEHMEVIGQNAGETVDQLIATELSAGGTEQLANAKTNITAVAATDTLTGAEIRKAVRTLKKNKAKRFEDGLYKAIVPTSAAYDLRGNSEWLDAYKYTDATNIRKGLLGQLHGVNMYETAREQTTSSTATVYSTFVFGKNAYGVVRLGSNAGPKVYVKTPGPSSTGNPIDLFSTVGWKVPFVAKTLNSTWIINIKSGVTA